MIEGAHRIMAPKAFLSVSYDTTRPRTIGKIQETETSEDICGHLEEPESLPLRVGMTLAEVEKILTVATMPHVDWNPGHCTG
jgi:hypothetical protein